MTDERLKQQGASLDAHIRVLANGLSSAPDEGKRKWVLNVLTKLVEQRNRLQEALDRGEPYQLTMTVTDLTLLDAVIPSWSNVEQEGKNE